MIRTLATAILFSFASQFFAQTSKKQNQKEKDDFFQKIEKVNFLLEKYRKMSPLSEEENKDKIIDSTGNEIVSGLLKILNDKRIQQYKIEMFIDENGLSISKSPDSKIYFFSIDAKTGGAVRSNKTIIHYRLPNGEVKAKLFGGEASEALAISAYEKVHLLDSATREYFVIGRVHTCNTCVSSLGITIKLDSNAYKTELVAQYEGRISNLVNLEFNPAAKELLFEYYTADKDDALYASDNENPQFLHRYKSKFKYLFGELIEIERCEFLDKKD
ncbi:MAG: hypothetical protein V4635_06600 [Bacteroidota bacterium]